MLVLMETWQTPNDYFHLNLLTPCGYKYFSKPCLCGRNGGLTVVYRNVMKIVMTEYHVKSIEYMAFKVLTHTTLLIIFIYHPPKPLLDYFSELLTLAYNVSSCVILLGDFNIHFASMSILIPVTLH